VQELGRFRSLMQPSNRLGQDQGREDDPAVQNRGEQAKETSLLEEMKDVEDRLRTLRDVRTQIQELRRQAQLEDVEREQAALEREDVDTVRLIATVRTQLLGMYDEILGGINATLADYEEKLRVLNKEKEEAWQNSRESSARMRLFPQRTRLSEETENNAWLEVRRARLRGY
jgi:hypothetical protein